VCLAPDDLFVIVILNAKDGILFSSCKSPVRNVQYLMVHIYILHVKQDHEPYCT
jgi:hypothetical protein